MIMSVIGWYWLTWKQILLVYYEYIIEKRLNLKWWYSYKHDKIRKAIKYIENASPYMFNNKKIIQS